MGIKQFDKLVQTFAPEACEIKRLPDFAGQILAIDVSNFMYQFAYNAQAKKPNYHLAGFFQLVHELASAKILPLMIFDGAPDQAKDHILTQRQDEKTRKQNKIADLQTTITTLSQDLQSASQAQLKALVEAQSQIKKTDKQIIEVTSQMWTELRHFFQLMGVPVLDASGEADVLASQLNAEGLIGGIISEDMDHLVFGAKVLIRDFNNKRSPDHRVYSYQALLKGLELSPRQLIHVGILSGCDYTPKITGIAWKRAYELIKEHQSLETILELISKSAKGFSKFQIPEGFDYVSAVTLFESKDPVAQAEDLKEKLRPRELQMSELKSLLMNSCSYRETTIVPKLELIEKFYQRWNSKLDKSLEKASNKNSNTSSTSNETESSLEDSGEVKTLKLKIPLPRLKVKHV